MKKLIYIQISTELFRMNTQKLIYMANQISNYFGSYPEKKAIISILIGLFLGLLLFPSPDFSKSILVGILLPFDLFPNIVTSSLLFWSFLLATVGPAIAIMNYDSFKR